MLKQATGVVNPRGEQSAKFFELVHQILVKERRYRVREVAARLGMSYPTFYARVTGRSTFSPDEINRLLRLISDVRLVDWILSNSSFIAAARPENDNLDLHKSAMEHVVLSVEHGLAMMKELSAAGVEDKVDKYRRERINNHIKEMQRSMVTLAAALPYLCAHPKRVHDRLSET